MSTKIFFEKNSCQTTVALTAVVLVALMAGARATAQTETILHSFSPTGIGGDTPEGGLIFDAVGNRYGTTTYGGIYGGGTVFELSPASAGAWTAKVMHSFGNGHDAAGSFAGLVLDAAGNMYGTAGSGGQYGYGAVFELSPTGTGTYNERVIHSFNSNGTDGTYPFAGLLIDVSGTLYGTTTLGGTAGKGVVFELIATPGGSWTETILHQFNAIPGDGFSPEGVLIMDAAGNLFGTTSAGGSSTACSGGCGTVFKLTPATGGVWTESILHTFGIGDDGQVPQAGLVADASGNLYGATSYGGSAGDGTAYELTPSTGGAYTEKLIHNFGSSAADGVDPVDALIFDSAGNLYGTTSAGGGYGYGTAFELSPMIGGGYAERHLHSFGNGRDGQYLAGGLLIDSSGILYGTTLAGGAYGYGTVFKITP